MTLINSATAQSLLNGGVAQGPSNPSSSMTAPQMMSMAKSGQMTQPSQYSMTNPQTGQFNTSPMQMPASYTSPYAGQAYSPNTVPVSPEYNQTFNPQTESIAPQMATELNGLNYDTQPLDTLKSNAESTSPSPWANLMSQTARTNTQQAGSDAAAQTAGSVAQGEGNLAMSGGLSSGARERLQQSGDQAGIGAQQNIARQGATDLSNIGLQDQSTKQQEMMALPGMETQAYQTQLQPISMMGQAQAQDVANQGNSIAGLNSFNSSMYGNQASMYGAARQADATQEAANEQAQSSGLFGMGGFAGTGAGSSGGFLGMGNAGNNAGLALASLAW